MKIRVCRLKTIIQEELDSFKKLYEADVEETPEEELGPDAYAESAEQTEIILGELKEILEKWEETEYDSDEDRWREYAKDIQDLINQYEADDETDDDPDSEETIDVEESAAAAEPVLKEKKLKISVKKSLS